MLPLKKISIKFLLYFLEGLIHLKKLVILLFKWLKRPFFWLNKIIFRIFIFRPYQLYLAVKRRFVPLYQSPKNKFSTLLANHYIIHLVIISIGILTTTINTQAYEIRSDDLGQKSILFSLVGISKQEIIEETALSAPTNVSNYLGSENSVESIPQLTTEKIIPEESLVTTVEGGSALLKPEITTTTTDITNTNTATTIHKRRETIQYVVQSGETVSSIAENFSISTSTILWENNLSPRSYIRPGDELTILPISGIRHKVKSGENLGKIAATYNVDIEKIKEANRLTDTSTIKIGEMLLIPGGSKTYYSSESSSVLTSIKNIIIPPAAKVPVGSKMLWPTPGHRITQYFTWRHHGLDIDGDFTSPIYATESGTVILSGWNGGYGLSIDIDHGGGIKTRYGHLSKLFVSKGDYVNKGDTIGMMGSTGNSTGSHLHFEVIINGNKYNPLNYIQ